MKIIKLKTGTEKEFEFEFPTIVKVVDDYYLVSKKYFPETRTEKGDEKYIAINLNDGKWFDWGNKIPKFEPKMGIFEKGTKFEIEI